MVVVLDCNIYISLVISRQIDFIPRVQNMGHTIVSCNELIVEVKDVLNRAKLQRYLSATTISNVVELLQWTTTDFHIVDIPNVVTDLKDNYLFALSAVAKADYLVTGDKLLLAEKEYRGTKVISLAEFRQLVS